MKGVLLLLLCFLALAFCEIDGKPMQCSAHFNSTSHYLQVERFTTFSSFHEGVPVDALLVMVNAMFTPPLTNPEHGGVILSTGVIPGLYQDHSYVLKYDYHHQRIGMEIWKRKVERTSWEVLTYTHPHHVPFYQWIHIRFSPLKLTVNEMQLNFESHPEVRVVDHPPHPFFFIGGNFTGYIDEVMVWDSNNGNAAPCSPDDSSKMLLWLPFNECHGNVVADMSPSAACGRLRNAEKGCFRKFHKNGRHGYHHGQQESHRTQEGEVEEEKVVPLPFWLKNADLGVSTKVNFWEHFHPQNNENDDDNNPHIYNENNEYKGEERHGRHGSHHSNSNWRKHKHGAANIPFTWGTSVAFTNGFCPGRASESQVEAQCPYLKEDPVIGGHDGHEYIPPTPPHHPSNGGGSGNGNGNGNGWEGNGNENGGTDEENEGSDSIFLLVTLQLAIIGCLCCCCVRRRRNAAAANQQAYQAVPQVDVQTQAGPNNVLYDYEDYEMNVGYPGSYIPDVMQMRSADGRDSPVEIPPMMMYPIPGQPQAGYPQYMMPSMFYTAPYLPQVQPWVVPAFPADVDATQHVAEQHQQQEEKH